MFTFQPSLFPAGLFFPRCWENIPKEMCAIAQPKHCQTKPAGSYGSFQPRITQSCQKFAPWAIGFLFTNERWPWVLIFATLITQWLDVFFLPDTSYIPLETNVDVTGLDTTFHTVSSAVLLYTSLQSTKRFWFTAQHVGLIPCFKNSFRSFGEICTASWNANLICSCLLQNLKMDDVSPLPPTIWKWGQNIPDTTPTPSQGQSQLSITMGHSVFIITKTILQCGNCMYTVMYQDPYQWINLNEIPLISHKWMN